MAMSQEERLSAYKALIELLHGESIQLGDRLPGESELCWRLNIGRHLVRLLLTQLESEGVIERRARSGSYLLRTPEEGTVPVSARSLAPVTTGSHTISVMLSSRIQESALREIQSAAMNAGYLLQYYFGPDHDARPEEEQTYLEQAIQNGYCGALIHATPVAPGNAAFFRKASAHLRLAHIGYHSTALPEQSFFLPDMTAAGSACANYLIQTGCTRLRLVSSLPDDHHVTHLIARGVEAATTHLNLPISTTSVYAGEAARTLAEGSLQPDEGLILYHDERLPLLSDTARSAFLAGSTPPRAIWIREQSATPTPRGFPAYSFNWHTQVTDALNFVMSGSEAVSHRLYLPTFYPPQ